MSCPDRPRLKRGSPLKGSEIELDASVGAKKLELSSMLLENA